jgi:hypothetical protein
MIESVSPVITLEMILDADAYPHQVTLFNLRYPLGFFEVTPENVLSAIVDDIHIYWAVERLLRGEFKRSYSAATAEARKVFNAALAEANKVYDAALAEPRKVYTAARSEARKALVAAMVEPGKAYDAAMAQAFSDAFNAQFRAEVVA